jgi:ribosomal protein S15P/S13E
MKLLSIDVGIKNLAYCLLETDIHVPTSHVPTSHVPTSHAKIIAWDVINLCGVDPLCSECKKVAKFAQQKYYCAAHAKKSGLLLPNNTISLKKIKKMKLIDLHKVIGDYTIPNPHAYVKKEEVLKLVMTFMESKMLNSVTGAKANDMDLIQIGIAMRKAFDQELKDHLSTLTHIVIENQISPIANRMKTLQGMIAQFFIMHDKTQIIFVSAANKLKGHGNEMDIATDTSTYASRKKEGINITLKLLTERANEWLPHFTQHKKKDDLADAFLQGNWFLNSKEVAKK